MSSTMMRSLGRFAAVLFFAFSAGSWAHGADPLAQNDDGKTPAQIAQLKGRVEALKLLSAA